MAQASNSRPPPTTSRVLHQLRDSPLLSLASLALGPSPTQPQTQESSLLWFRPHSLLCGSCFARSLGLGGGEEWGHFLSRTCGSLDSREVPFLTKSPPFSTAYGVGVVGIFRPIHLLERLIRKKDVSQSSQMWIRPISLPPSLLSSCPRSFAP